MRGYNKITISKQDHRWHMVFPHADAGSSLQT